MDDPQLAPPMSADLDVVEDRFATMGWAIYTESGFVRRGVVDTEAFADFCGRFGAASGRDGGVEQWPVRPHSSDPAQTFSQRAGDAGLHTDAAYRADPESSFLLLCVRPATDGGYTRLLAGADAMRGIDPLLERRLRVPQWRWQVPAVFGGGLSDRRSVLDDDGGMRWRSDNLVVPADLERPAAAFTAHLETHSMIVQLLLPPDSVLVCDNRRVLHGRTGFTDRRRWLVRVRLTQR